MKRIPTIPFAVLQKDLSRLTALSDQVDDEGAQGLRALAEAGFNSEQELGEAIRLIRVRMFQQNPYYLG